MKRRGATVLATLLGTAGMWATAATAEAAYTWAGTWTTTVGGYPYADVVMDASGAGSYPGPSTISGGISGIDGRTNSGTWTQPTKSGYYTFNMSESGLGFTGTYSDGESGTCSSPPCTWDGTCSSGACLGNGPEAEPECEERSVFGCRWVIRFGFELRRGLPVSPLANELPRRLLAIDAETDGAKLLSQDRNPLFGEWNTQGHLIMRTIYRERGPGNDRRKIHFQIDPAGSYEREPGQIKLSTRLSVLESTDPKCPEHFVGRLRLKVRKLDGGGKAVKLIFDSIPDRNGDVFRCIYTNRFEELIWKTENFRRVRIGRPERVGLT